MLPPHSSSPTAPRPWRRGVGLLILAGRDFFRDNGPTWAAAIAYYSLLSLFPLLLAIGSIAAHFVDPQWAEQRATDYLGGLLPAGTEVIQRVVAQTLATARGSGWIVTLPLLWSGSLFFAVIIKALNIIFDAEERFGFVRRTLIRLAMLCTLGLAFLAALGVPIALHAVQRVLFHTPPGKVLMALLTYILPPAFLLAALALAYRYAPERRPAWRAALTGATVAAVLFGLGKPLFLAYVKSLGRYHLIYGSLAGIILVVFWTWLVAMIGLFGAQVACHMQAIWIDGRSLVEEIVRHLSRSERDLNERDRRA
jgi:membrane protein